ncbi:MAG: DUF2064 domain-containing protein [Solirubrobacteraceae bacterium]
MAPPPPSVLVMGAGEAAPELGDLLGAERAADVERLLRERALRWAWDVSPGGVHFPADSEGLADAVQRVLSDAGGGAVLVIWPALPRWGPEHAEGVLDDLASGCDASVGPVFDGGLYMLALRRVLPALFALPGETWESPDAMGRVLGAINDEGAPVGLLRAERGLRREADVRAALADPLLDEELRALLAG